MRRLVALALITVTALSSALSSCASDGTDATGTIAADATDAADAAASTVGVLASGCASTVSAGSGVVLGAPGQVVTVAHTVAGATRLAVVDAAGTEWPAQLMALDPDADLAVLAVDGLGAPPLASGGVALGAATVHVWSTDDGVDQRAVEVTKRLAITIDDIYGEESAQRSGIELAGDIDVGDSGGPVVTSDGTVIGIVYARSRTRASTAFATDATEIERVLASVSTDAMDAGRCV